MSQPERSTPPIDEQALADALNTRSATVQDMAYGEGVQYSTGRGSVRLEIFPHTGVTRLTAPDVRLELFGGTRVEVSDGGVEFSRTQPGQDASLTVVPDGGIVFTLVAGGEHRAPEGAAPRPAEPLPQPVAAPETPAARAAQTRQDEPARREEAPEQEAVTMQGRLGRSLVRRQRGLPHRRLPARDQRRQPDDLAQGGGV